MPTVALGKQVWDKNLSCNRALYRNNEFKKLPNKAIFRYQFSSMFKLVSAQYYLAPKVPLSASLVLTSSVLFWLKGTNCNLGGGHYTTGRLPH